MTWECFDNGTSERPVFERCDPDFRALWQLLHSLEAMGAPARPWAAPKSVADLETEMLRYRNEADDAGDDDAKVTELSKKWIPLIDLIAVTPSNSLPGLAAKLRTLNWLTENYGDDWEATKVMARTAREDAERLVGAS